MSKHLWVAGLFLSVASAATGPSLPQMRMTPPEVRATTFDGSQVGSSAVAGVRSKVMFGDPAKAGFYTILLFVPVHTTIQAHSHRDDRMAVVVSGEWHFGYGNHFDEESLKTLPPGSVYSEPGGQTHFARTGNEPVIVEISGYGPTDTRYFDPINDPALQQKK
jgi:uncharacterized RmlC-like cupin family protein